MWRKAASFILLGGFLVSQSLGARVILQPTHSATSSTDGGIKPERGFASAVSAGVVAGALSGAIFCCVDGFIVGGFVGGAYEAVHYCIMGPPRPIPNHPPTLLD